MDKRGNRNDLRTASILPLEKIRDWRTPHSRHWILSAIINLKMPVTCWQLLFLSYLTLIFQQQISSMEWDRLFGVVVRVGFETAQSWRSNPSFSRKECKKWRKTWVELATDCSQTLTRYNIPWTWTAQCREVTSGPRSWRTPWILNSANTELRNLQKP